MAQHENVKYNQHERRRGKDNHRNKHRPRTGRKARRANYDSYIIPTQVFDRLMEDAIGECAFCTKQGKEVKKCQKRRDLAKCGIVTDRAGECPYQG